MSSITPPPGRRPRFIRGSSSLTGRVIHYVWYKPAGILMATFWMFEVSFWVSLLLAWVPVVGPFLGPVAGGLVGGRRAGTPGRALLSAVLPAILLTLLIVGLGAVAVHFTQTPLIGALATVLAGAAGVIAVIHNLLLFGAALAGGWMKQRETAGNG